MPFPKFGHPWVSEVHAPVFIYKAPPYPDDAEYTRFLAHHEEWLREVQEPFSFVVTPQMLSHAQRKATSESQNRRMAYEKRYNVALAFVIDNPVLRGIVTAVFWMSQPLPYGVFKTQNEAYLWAVQTYREAVRAKQPASALT